MDMKDDELRISLKFLTGELMKVYTGTIFVDDVEKLCEELKGVKYEHERNYLHTLTCMPSKHSTHQPRLLSVTSV
jgi:hypothetical protein